MSGSVTIDGVRLSVEVARLIELVGVCVADDVAHVREAGSCDGLLVDCLEGCEDEATELLWREYVSAVCAAAEVAS